MFISRSFIVCMTTTWIYLWWPLEVYDSENLYRKNYTIILAWSWPPCQVWSP